MSKYNIMYCVLILHSSDHMEVSQLADQKGELNYLLGTQYVAYSLKGFLKIKDISAWQHNRKYVRNQSILQ